MNNTLHFEGILRLRETPPDWDEATLKYWWARMTEREKDRWTLWEGENMLMNAGRNQVLTFIGQATAPATFSQQFAVGTGTIYTVQPSDTSLSTELARVAPASFSIVGNTVTVTSTFTTGQANGTWSNAGLFGVSATSTANSGTLMTHILCSFTKTSASAITCDYSISLT